MLKIHGDDDDDDDDDDGCDEAFPGPEDADDEYCVCIYV